MSDLRTISISQIRENPVALRNVNKDSEDFVGLRDSIGRVGILNPISVRQKVDNVDGDTVEYFELIDGLHRYTAAKELGLEEVPVTVLSLDDTAVLEAQYMANVHKIETKPAEYAKQLTRILASNPTMTINELAGRLCHAPSWIAGRLNILRLDAQIQKTVDDGKMPVTNAVLLAKLPRDEQFALLDQAISTPTQEFATTVATRQKELRQAAREGKSPEDAVFAPTHRIRKVTELKDEYEKPVVGPALCRQAGVTTAEEGFALGVAYALSLDPVSVAAQENAYNERKAQANEAKQKRAVARAQKKADEALAEAEKVKAAAGV